MWNTKTAFKSKTLWINGAVFITAWILNHKGVLAGAGIDGETQVLILAVVNFINRFFTTTELTVG